MAIVLGTVKFWKPSVTDDDGSKSGGWGYLIPDDYGPDVFGNIKDCERQRNLVEGQRVQFAIGQGPLGKPQAKFIKPLT